MSAIIHKTKLISASQLDVYHRWTSNEESPKFFAPKCHIELKIGGPYEQYFALENEPGIQGSEGCTILSYLPNQMLSYSWNAPPHIPEVRNHAHKAWVVIWITERPNNQCTVDLYHLGFLNGPAWDETIQYFENAWDQVLENLATSFQ